MTAANKYPPLEHVQRPTVNTAHAAYYLDRSPPTLRDWACKGTGPIAPRNIGGRLAWPVAELKALLGVGA